MLTHRLAAMGSRLASLYSLVSLSFLCYLRCAIIREVTAFTGRIVNHYCGSQLQRMSNYPPICIR